MSRRRGEFEHRTTIFEGAFRAWSHLGGLDPEDLETKSSADLDPLTNPLVNDARLTGKDLQKNQDGTTRKEYPYEPLPRAGLAHPFVQAILSPWLGPDADNEAIQLGLTTLRTWWQHRRKGESGSAIAALSTEKMKGVVEGYTRHFFTLAHCIVVNDRVQPPKGLLTRLKEVEKKRAKQVAINSHDKAVSFVNANASAIRSDLTDPNLTPLEKLHVAQRRQLENSTSVGMTAPLQGISSRNGLEGSGIGAAPILSNMQTGKCTPGKVDIPGIVDAINQRAAQLSHHGFTNGVGTDSFNNQRQQQQSFQGDPNTTPVVLVSSNGDIQIAMKVHGITCAHCVKIVETVLRGCNGNKSPISGLLDAAADEKLGLVILKIVEASAAKRIAFEAARNLGMVGYVAEALNMSIVGTGADPVSHADLGALATAFEVVASADPSDVFDWNVPCSCPDNGIVRLDCKRHSQMNTRMFDAFRAREKQVMDYMAGCGMKYGMDCTCGPDCRCKNCPLHSEEQKLRQLREIGSTTAYTSMGSVTDGVSSSSFDYTAPMQEYGDTFNMDPLPAVPPFNQPNSNAFSHYHDMTTENQQPNAAVPSQNNLSNIPMINPQHTMPVTQQRRVSRVRNNSVLSYGNRGSVRDGNRSSLRGMSITSETTFGRAMSGLSALSIDWENLDDFDLDVDHSAHINQSSPIQPNGNGASPRRTSATRRSFLSTGSQDGGTGTQVSFKVQ